MLVAPATGALLAAAVASDALAVVVSEETGAISVAFAGEMTRSLDAVEGVRKALGQQSIDNRPALILEYIEGETLLDCISKKALNLLSKLEIAVNLARVLGRIHQQNVIHQDLNSKNILIGNQQQAIMRTSDRKRQEP